MLRVEDPPYDYTMNKNLFDFTRCSLGFDSSLQRIAYFTNPNKWRGYGSWRQKTRCTMELAEADTCTLNYQSGMNRRAGVLK